MLVTCPAKGYFYVRLPSKLGPPQQVTFLLCIIWQEHRDLLADALDTVELQDGQPLFKQGDIGSQFYIIKSGKVHVLKGPDTKPLAELREGQFFGERSLIRDDPRLACIPLKHAYRN